MIYKIHKRIADSIYINSINKNEIKNIFDSKYK